MCVSVCFVLWWCVIIIYVWCVFLCFFFAFAVCLLARNAWCGSLPYLGTRRVFPQSCVTVLVERAHFSLRQAFLLIVSGRLRVECTENIQTSDRVPCGEARRVAKAAAGRVPAANVWARLVATVLLVLCCGSETN